MHTKLHGLLLISPLIWLPLFFAASWISEIRHHRHWQKVLQHVCGCHLSMLAFNLPEQGMIIGGTMSLRGNNLSLACFHGINFGSKSWALFTMDEPCIRFDTEAQDLTDEGKNNIKSLSATLYTSIIQTYSGLHRIRCVLIFKKHLMIIITVKMCK